MALIYEIIVALIIFLGTMFSVAGVLGFIRFPDVYTKLHATGKVGVFGVVLLLLAGVISGKVSLGMGLVLMFFLMITGPTVTHAVGSAAYRLGIPMKDVYRDDLAQQKVQGEQTE